MSIEVLVHASEVLTGRGVRKKDGRRVTEADLDRIEDGAVAYETRGKILWVGKTSELPKKFGRAKKRDLKNRFAVIPGLVDCHNHLIFAGDRADEFAARCGGATYEEIAKNGGGIVKTVSATREASRAALLKIAVERVKKSMSYGVRTLEIKSGYGLDEETELKILHVARDLKKKFPQMTFSTTYLGAHAFPKDMPRDIYFRQMMESTLPKIAREKLADCCDVFIDEGYFTLQEAKELLSAAKKLGLKTKIHADELGNTGSATLAAELGSLSADHLLQISNQGIAKLAKSQTVAVLLPGTAFYLKAAYAPARRLIDAGACVALSTDFNPGTCVTLNLPAVMTIAALYMRMSQAEIFSAVTYGGAKALGLSEQKGTLEEGKHADLIVLPYKSFAELYYNFAW